MVRLSLKKNFVWAFIGNVISSACRWGMLVVLAKLTTVEMVGLLAYALAVASPITIFCKLQLGAIFVTDAQNRYSFFDYLALRTITSIISVSVIAIIALVTSEEIESVSVIMIVGFSQGFLSIREIFLCAMQKNERMDMVSRSNIILGILSLFSFTLTLYLTGRLVFAVFATVAIRLPVLFTYDRLMVQKLLPVEETQWHKLSESIRCWKGILKLTLLSLPLGITMLLISLNTNIPRYFLKHFHGEATLGYYAAIASLLVAGQLVIMALGQSAFPRLAKYYVDNKPAFKKLLAKLVGIGFGLGGLGLLLTISFGKYILSALFTSEYASYSRELNWIVLAGSFTFASSFLGYGLTAARYFKIQIPIFGIVLVVNVIGNLVLVPQYKIIGIAWSLVIASNVGLVLIFLAIAYALWKKKENL